MKLFGGGIFLIPSAFSGSYLQLFSSIISLKYFIWFIKNLHLSEPSLKPYSFMIWNPALMCFLCCSLISLLNKVSSWYPGQIWCPLHIGTSWNHVGTSFNSKGRRFSLKSPLCVLIANFQHSLSTFTCRYASDRPILENTFHHLALRKYLPVKVKGRCGL